MKAFLLTLFNWPNGIVVGNLLASAIWAIPGIIHLDRLARKHHRIHMAELRKHGSTGSNSGDLSGDS